MKVRLLACLLVLALAGTASARPVAGISASRVTSSWSIWNRLVDLIRGFPATVSPFASDHTIPPPSTCLWSIW